MDTQQIEAEALPVVTRANNIVVTNNAEYGIATEFVKDVKRTRKKVEDWFAPMVEAAHKAHKEIVAKRDSVLNPLKQAEATINRACLVFYESEERRRQEEQRRLQAEAEEAARKERERLEKLAASRKTPEKQEEYRQAAAMVVAPVVNVESAVAPQAGRAIVKRWTFEIVDEAKIPREFLMVDETKLSKYATAMKAAAKVDGVRFMEKAQFSTRL